MISVEKKKKGRDIENETQKRLLPISVALRQTEP